MTKQVLLVGVQPLNAQAPRTIIESAVPIGSVKTENVRSVILDPKDDVLVLDDLKVKTKLNCKYEYHGWHKIFEKV